MVVWRLVAGLVWISDAVVAQDADLTIFVDGPLLEHGGVVEVTAVATPDAPVGSQEITLTDRYAQLQFHYREGAKYQYRFRPTPDAIAREGVDQFVTEVLSIGQGRSIRVLPFAEYGAPDSATRTDAAWGTTQAYADRPPANHWGARALPGVFDTFGTQRSVDLICEGNGAVLVCTPDPNHALLMEALWWRSIAEGRLERLRSDALEDCYDGGGLFGRPKRCEGEPGRGWPVYRPAD